MPPGLTLRVREVGGDGVPVLRVVGEWLGAPPPPSPVLRNLVGARAAEFLAPAWRYVDRHPDVVLPGETPRGVAEQLAVVIAAALGDPTILANQRSTNPVVVNRARAFLLGGLDRLPRYTGEAFTALTTEPPPAWVTGMAVQFDTLHVAVTDINVWRTTPGTRTAIRFGAATGYRLDELVPELGPGVFAVPPGRNYRVQAVDQAPQTHLVGEGGAGTYGFPSVLQVTGEPLGDQPLPSADLVELIGAAAAADLLAGSWAYLNNHPDVLGEDDQPVVVAEQLAVVWALGLGNTTLNDLFIVGGDRRDRAMMMVNAGLARLPRHRGPVYIPRNYEDADRTTRFGANHTRTYPYLLGTRDAFTAIIQGNTILQVAGPGAAHVGDLMGGDYRNMVMYPVGVAISYEVPEAPQELQIGTQRRPRYDVTSWPHGPVPGTVPDSVVEVVGDDAGEYWARGWRLLGERPELVAAGEPAAQAAAELAAALAALRLRDEVNGRLSDPDNRERAERVARLVTAGLDRLPRYENVAWLPVRLIDDILDTVDAGATITLRSVGHGQTRPYATLPTGFDAVLRITGPFGAQAGPLGGAAGVVLFAPGTPVRVRLRTGGPFPVLEVEPDWEQPRGALPPLGTAPPHVVYTERIAPPDAAGGVPNDTLFSDLHGDEWAYVTDDGEPTWRPFAQYVSALTWRNDVPGDPPRVTAVLPLPLWLRPGHNLTPHPDTPWVLRPPATVDDAGNQVPAPSVVEIVGSGLWVRETVADDDVDAGRIRNTEPEPGGPLIAVGRPGRPITAAERDLAGHLIRHTLPQARPQAELVLAGDIDQDTAEWALRVARDAGLWLANQDDLGTLAAKPQPVPAPEGPQPEHVIPDVGELPPVDDYMVTDLMVAELDHGIATRGRQVVVNGTAIEKAYIIVPRDQADSWSGLRDGLQRLAATNGITASRIRPSKWQFDPKNVVLRVSIPPGAAILVNATDNVLRPTDPSAGSRTRSCCRRTRSAGSP